MPGARSCAIRPETSPAPRITAAGTQNAAAIVGLLLGGVLYDRSGAAALPAPAPCPWIAPRKR
ncbi:MAG TPA: hypothetical protein VKA86_01900, partial [Candidatus Krumholzibacteria bacterium]|nr:hypothetical protein [Candidatus Krumholzibacteria bacterium]